MLNRVIKSGGFIDMCMTIGASIPMPDRNVCNGLFSNVDADKFPYAIGVDKGLCLRWDETPNKKKAPVEYEQWVHSLVSMGVPQEFI